LGRIQRRVAHRRDAGETLRHAIALFDGMSASVWTAAATAELGRIGGRASAGNQLTDSERRVAELVVRGHTNREVAAELFVTPKAVEMSLSRIFVKRGVRSRTELASLLATEGYEGKN
jgi:DNA-binding NarL/FixJ family response regulator